MSELRNITFSTYSSCAASTDKYPDDLRLLCCSLGIMSEHGEFAGKVDKHYRKTGTFDPTPDERLHIVKELGDILWFTTEVLRCLTIYDDNGVRPVTIADAVRKALEPYFHPGDNICCETFNEFDAICSTMWQKMNKPRIFSEVFFMNEPVSDFCKIAHLAILDGMPVLDAVDSGMALSHLSDIICYIARSAHAIGYSFEEIARINILKLQDRDRRDQIASIVGGDDR